MSFVGLRQFCQLTRDGEVYHEYCLNYSKAMTYLERLRKNEDFCEFEKVRTSIQLDTTYQGLPTRGNSPKRGISGFRGGLGPKIGRLKMVEY